MPRVPRKRRSRFRFQDQSLDVDERSYAAQASAFSDLRRSMDSSSHRYDQSPQKSGRDDMWDTMYQGESAVGRTFSEYNLEPDTAGLFSEIPVAAESASEEERFADEPENLHEREMDTAVQSIEAPDAAELSGAAARGVQESEPDCDIGNGGGSLKIYNWRVLWGILLTTGSQKLTKFQYQAMRVISDAFHRLRDVGAESWTRSIGDREENQLQKLTISCLPHYTTLFTKFKPIIFKSLAARSADSLETVDTSKAGARARSYSEDGTPKVAVRTVLPSEYARSDLATGPVFRLLKSTSLSANPHLTRIPAISTEECVDIWPVIAAREYFYDIPRSISVDSDGWRADGNGCAYAEPGDLVEVQILGEPILHPEISSLFKFGETGDGYARLCGTISAIWTVHHNSREGASFKEPLFGGCADDRDRRLASLFGFCDYKSPSDAVTIEVPELPAESDCDEDEAEIFGGADARRKKKKYSPEMADAIRVRKEAVRRRRDQIEQAWSGWEKPLIKPGDTVCLLQPRRRHGALECAHPDMQSRLVVAHRFWTENEERDRHIFWVPASLDLDAPATSTRFVANPGQSVLRDGRKPEQLCTSFTSSSPDLYREIVKVSLQIAHPGARGPQRFDPISSMGRLDSGEEYFIYRFLLFWDGFEVSKGKSASGDGFYMVCLNMPSQARNSANAVRIISLCPPGVKSATLFDRIKADILKGMTEGFVDIDASGTRRKIFLDLVGFLGDTPALNTVLDTLGHTASACCHLCKFSRRSAGLLGSRYTAVTQCGLESACGRGFYQHLAIRDCKAGKESCRLLGLKPYSRSDDLPLHSLREAMMSARTQIPTTGGKPIVSGFLDPYKSCFVAPDHLLTGHLRDCMNMAFKLLPSKEYRKSCESFMIGFLRDCQLPVQNRLFDMEKKSLYSMSMTEIYALSVVAEHGFRKGCQAKYPEVDERHRPSSKCIEAISIVGSASSLISALWRLPTEKDAPYAIRAFNNDGGNRRMHGLQEMIRNHILSLQCICSMQDNDVLDLENNSCSRARKAQLAKLRFSCLVARRCVDKPNVHRLLELGSSTLPLIGHISRVGELCLEKAHQRLKRAIKQSNNKDVQLPSMNSAVFKDWQARLTMLVDDALAGDKYAIFGCYRLLQGREAAIDNGGRITSSIENQVRRALGPPCCVPSFLASAKKSVISPRSNLDKVSWTLEGNLTSFSLALGPAEESRMRVYSALRACGLFEKGTIIMADTVRATSKKGMPLLSLTRGDVVEIVAYRPLDASFHTPFIVHRHNVGQEMAGCLQGPSAWAVSAFISLQMEREEKEVWASVHPCLTATCASREGGLDGHNYRYHIGTSLSFVKVDLRSLSQAAVLHDCDPTLCTPRRLKTEIDHGNKSLLEAPGEFYVIGRAKGYPPRRG